MARTNQARYFIRVDTYWQNSPDYFVGPFDSRETAEQAVSSIETRDNVWLSTSTCGGDIRTAVRVYPSILTATDAKRSGMVEDLAHPKYNIIPRMPTGSEDLFYMLEAIR